jgi:hypothetical protein
MCELTTIALGVSVATTAYSAYAQGQAASKAAKANARLDEYNAKLADARSADATERGAITAAQVKTEGAQAAGEGRTSFAAGNVDLSSGSVKYWELDTAAGIAKDAGLVKYNASQEAAGIQGQAYNARASSRLSRAQGRSALTAGYINAGSSLLAGAAETAYKYQDRKGKT